MVPFAVLGADAPPGAGFESRTIAKGDPRNASGVLHRNIYEHARETAPGLLMVLIVSWCSRFRCDASW